MAPTSRRRSAVKESIDDILRRLSAIPSSPEADGLRALAEGYLGEADAWSASQPVAAEKERLMKRLLKLHLEVAKLERRPPGA
jgi:hypothetical protein